MKYINKKATKLVTTIGPSTHSLSLLKQAFESGSTCIRLNFSHGDAIEQGERITNANLIMDQYNEPYSILLDTKGPEIRTHEFENGRMLIEKGDKITIYCDKQVLGQKGSFSVDYPGFAHDLKPEKLILLDDGKLHLKVLRSAAGTVEAEALNTHVVKNKRRINLPGTAISITFLSEKDKKDILFGIKSKVDYIAASFVRDHKDVLEVRHFLNANDGHDVKIVSKIECQTAVDDFEAILKESDGIMHARGDLGIEIPFEDVPLLQIKYAKRCKEVGKPFIVATQMLESMTSTPFPTRAEVMDVYMAAAMDSSATMLSGESANGDYPILAIQTMAKITKKAQENNSQKVRNTLIAEINELNLPIAVKNFAIEILEKHVDAVVFNKQDKDVLHAALLGLPVDFYYFTSNRREFTAYGINRNVFTVLSNDPIDEKNYIEELNKVVEPTKYKKVFFAK